MGILPNLYLSLARSQHLKKKKRERDVADVAVSFQTINTCTMSQTGIQPKTELC